ncbi:hypothetical protein Nepgr_014179 [Nepenthes gracilis]|uniref:CCT domain-containing protein n=1 Tax=Nepenthes gracilis TaxID=150966 RepID=A0AAD3SJI6_NEPGR|nr:hypothetical protein Nepgr_014179 [Nepenthes gracilis]
MVKSYSHFSRNPTKEEQQVLNNPDAENCTTRKLHCNDEVRLLGEFEGVFGIEEDEESISETGDDNIKGGRRLNSLDFTKCDGLPVPQVRDLENDGIQVTFQWNEEESDGDPMRKGTLGSRKDIEENKACLNLNLNYQEVIEAWSNSRSLYANNDFSFSMSNNYCMGEVPAVEEGRTTRREASVLRYKEKRQSRLFSKKIRYEVRKLNADKRPRIKGRFVKRGPGIRCE